MSQVQLAACPRGRPAVFLDRDGTINREVDYLAKAEDFEFLPGAVDALKRLSQAGFELVVVTNQSGIARGYFDEAALLDIHQRMTTELHGAGVELSWIGFCPHHPSAGEPPLRARCSCRKPQPGLLIEATAALDLDLGGSWCVGDSLRDLSAAAAVHVPGILVRTGKGESEERKLERGQTSPPVVADLGAAADWILSR